MNVRMYEATKGFQFIITVKERGGPMDLTSFTVTLSVAGQAYVCTVTDPLQGRVLYRTTGAEVLAPGRYPAKLHLVSADTDVYTEPFDLTVAESLA